MTLLQNILRIKQNHALPRQRRVRESIKIIMLLCGLLFISTAFFPSEHAPNIRKLRMVGDGTGEYCPYMQPSFFVPHERTAGPAVDHLRTFDLESVLQESLEASALNGKTILVGDSLTRQSFIAFSCLLYKSGLVNGNKDSYIAWQSDREQDSNDRQFNDARAAFRWKGKANQIFFHPTAGRVNEYGWGYERPSSPMEGTENWLESCKKREPFLLDTYRLKDESSHIQHFFNNHDFEKLQLDNNDAVIINAGFHPSTRSRNLEKIAELTDCMNEARVHGEGQNWPKIYYMRTSQQHWPSEDGTSNKEVGGLPCRSLKHGQDPYYVQDLKYLEGKVHILGDKIDFNQFSQYHIGAKKTRYDCSHWALPGVPNLFVKEIMKARMNETGVGETVI